MRFRPGERVRIIGWSGDATHIGFDDGLVAGADLDGPELYLVADLLGQESVWLPPDQLQSAGVGWTGEP